MEMVLLIGAAEMLRRVLSEFLLASSLAEAALRCFRNGDEDSRCKASRYDATNTEVRREPRRDAGDARMCSAT